MLLGIAVILAGISATFAMLSAKSQNIDNFSQIISYINWNIRYQQTAGISAVFE